MYLLYMYYIYVYYIHDTNALTLLSNRRSCSVIITVEMYITLRADTTRTDTDRVDNYIYCATKIIAPSTRQHMTSNHRISKGGFFYTIGAIYLFINIFFLSYIIGIPNK